MFLLLWPRGFPQWCSERVVTWGQACPWFGVLFWLAPVRLTNFLSTIYFWSNISNSRFSWAEWTCLFCIWGSRKAGTIYVCILGFADWFFLFLSSFAPIFWDVFFLAYLLFGFSCIWVGDGWYLTPLVLPQVPWLWWFLVCEKVLGLVAELIVVFGGRSLIASLDHLHYNCVASMWCVVGRPSLSILIRDDSIGFILFLPVLFPLGPSGEYDAVYDFFVDLFFSWAPVIFHCISLLFICFISKTIGKQSYA